MRVFICSGEGINEIQTDACDIIFNAIDGKEYIIRARIGGITILDRELNVVYNSSEGKEMKDG